MLPLPAVFLCWLRTVYQISPEVLVRKNRRLRKNNSYILLITPSEDSHKILKDTCILTQDEEDKIT
jgi:DNA-binding transcriptional regulator WhiA